MAKVKRLIGHNDDVVIVSTLNVSHPAGASDDAPVTVHVHHDPLSGDGTTQLLQWGMPGGYSVHVEPSQPCFVQVTKKQPFDFDIVVTPMPARTLAKGSLAVTIIG